MTDLKVDMLQKMGAKVGYTYSSDYLKRQIYAPRGISQAEQELLQIRQGLVKIVTEAGLKVVVTEFPPAPPA
jgi:hypothetical protein